MLGFFFAVFYEILLKFSDFVNFHNCIGKIVSKSIRLSYSFLFIKKFEVNKKQFFSGEKMRNLGNCIYN